MRYLVVVVALSLVLGLGCSPQAEDESRAIFFDGLGDLHRSVSTEVAGAQRFFDQGLTLYYGFNHEDAKATDERVRRAWARSDINPSVSCFCRTEI
jgi:hypothetical protein